MSEPPQVSVLASPSERRFDRLTPALGWGLALGAGCAAGLIISLTSRPLYFFAAIAGIGAVLLIIARVEWGLLVLVFITYTRFSDIAIEYHGAPSVAKLFVPLLLFAIMVRWVLYRERPVGWGLPALLIALYGLVGFASLLTVPWYERTLEALLAYAKDSVVAIVVVVLIQRGIALRRAVWVIVGAGLFMGTIAVVQHLTGTFDNSYAGFGQAMLMHIAGDQHGYRVAGPIGDPNFFAQILLVPIPLALDRFRRERARLPRLVAGWALVACFVALVLTFSRGAFVALVVMAVLVAVRWPPRPRTAVAMLLGVALLTQLLATEYLQRMSALTTAVPGVADDMDKESSVSGRMDEMLVGWLIFTDHPVTGVGLNTYQNYFQQYVSRAHLKPRLEDRPAHSLYLEILAETGLIGFAVFGILMLLMLRGMRSANRKLRAAGLSDYSDMVSSLGIGIAGYLVAATFLHDAYPRYFWLLVGLAFSVPQVARQLLNERTPEAVDTRTPVSVHAG